MGATLAKGRMVLHPRVEAQLCIAAQHSSDLSAARIGTLSAQLCTSQLMAVGLLAHMMGGENYATIVLRVLAAGAQAILADILGIYATVAQVGTQLSVAVAAGILDRPACR